MKKDMKNGLIIDITGTKRWYLNDKIHREDGPAIIFDDGIKEWFLNDEMMSEKRFNTIIFANKLNKELTTKKNKSKKIKI